MKIGGMELWGLFIIILLTSVIYLQIGQHIFLNYDDDQYITSNSHVIAGLTKESILWGFKSTENFNWHPVTWFSHQLDVSLFGLNPKWHHYMNLLYHLAATSALFYLIKRISNSIQLSFFIAILFAIHPLHVESVAWVSERKDLLCAIFYFLSLNFYLKYLQQIELFSANYKQSYVISLAFFVLAISSKAMAVTLPLLLYVLDSNFSNRKRYVDKIPFFILSVAISFVTIYAQNSGGAVAGLTKYPLLLRLQTASVAYIKYIYKLLIPLNLSVFYPLSIEVYIWKILVAISLVVAVTLLIKSEIQKLNLAKLGWQWFLISLIPVIGIIQVGNQEMADRYSYIPSVGLFLCVAIIFNHYFGKYKTATLAISVILIISYSIISYKEIGYWINSETLYLRALAVTKNNYTIHYNLGVTYLRDKRYREAMEQFQKGIAIKPDDVDLQKAIKILK